jgi:hypothetical protein
MTFLHARPGGLSINYFKTTDAEPDTLGGMTANPVQDWLTRWVARERATALGAAAAALAGGAFAYLITLAITDGAVWFIIAVLFSGSSTLAFFLSLGLMVALLFGELTTSREYLESYSFSTGTASDQVVTFDVPMVGMVSNINPLAPDSAHTFVKMIVSLLFTAPRLIMAGVRRIRRAKKLKDLDVDACAAVLSLLLERGQRVSLNEVMAAFPELPMERVFPQLGLIEGVLFLKTGQPGLSLSSDLRGEIVTSNRPS